MQIKCLIIFNSLFFSGLLSIPLFLFLFHEVP